MISKPSKFRAQEWSQTAPPDDTECMPQLGGDGYGEFPLLGRYRVSRDVYEQEFNTVFSRPETIDCVVRILCLCDLEKNCDPIKNSEIDVYMWQHYAANFEGLRIGIELDIDDDGVCNMINRFRGEYVKYRKVSNVIQPCHIENPDDLSEACFNVLYRKPKKFEIESEYRLIVAKPFWKMVGETCFLPLDNAMIVSVDVGQKMPQRAAEELYFQCAKNFSLRRFAKAREVEGTVLYCEWNPN